MWLLIRKSSAHQKEPHEEEHRGHLQTQIEQRPEFNW